MTTLNSLFIATGTNLGDRKKNLLQAREYLQHSFKLIAESRIYESLAVDYCDQPDFYNQVLEFELTNLTPNEVMLLLLNIESILGRDRLIPKGPRLIDLDILFWGTDSFHNDTVQIPHPRLFARSFVVLPLSELPGFRILKEHFPFNFNFNNSAKALS